MNQKVILSLFKIFTLYLLFNYIIELFILLHKPYNWGTGELLINYQGGFVKRGLLGELIYQIATFSGLNIIQVSVSLCFICLLFTIYFFCKTFLKYNMSFYLIPYNIVLGVLFSTTGVLIRKDIILTLLFFLALIALKKQRYLIYNIISILGIMIHETFFFISVPILFHYRFSILLPVPLLVFFILTIFYNGDVTLSKDIVNSLNHIIDITDIDLGSILVLGWENTKHLEYFNKFLNHNNLISLCILWLWVVVATYFSLISLKSFSTVKDRGRFINRLSYYLVLNLICISPLFILACDWGRWIYLWVTSSIIIAAYIDEKQYHFIQIIENFSLALIKINKPKLMIYLIFFIGMPLNSFGNIKEFFYNSPIGLTLSHKMPDRIIYFINLVFS